MTKTTIQYKIKKEFKTQIKIKVTKFIPTDRFH